MTPPEQSLIDWKDGVIPVSRRFDDPYFSLNDGLAETRHVFLAGNGLPERLRAGFHVAELGFGTGLNLLALCLLQPPAPMRFTSFEAFPLTAEEIARALDHFPEARAIADPFLGQWAAGNRTFTLGQVTANIIIGDARETLTHWPEKADAWFLDGFSPAKNPELWAPEMMSEVAHHTVPGGTFATYTAAGHVRRALAEAGFAVERRPGHGRKRHMSIGNLA
jgi:tRNA U34 5-methylaminomethyl-2-thiouridine-forming methyltransferase MnmC